MRIGLLTIGIVDAIVLDYLSRQIRTLLPTSITEVVPETMPLPVDAYSTPRDQYDSGVILPKLVGYQTRYGFDRLLGVTEADLYASSMNFVFGEAHPLWGVAVVSLRRLRPGQNGEAVNGQLLLERAAKEAVHELGHALELPHCSDPSCVMFFSNSISDTDFKGLEYCRRCKAVLNRKLPP